ncbi:MAG TPA: ATP-binding protein [Thermoanaerobaculia bacterium]|nr:ATP-binding protein [Thermoanaerobaculia bacterium]
MSQPIWTPKDSRRAVHAVEDLPRKEREETGEAGRDQAYTMEAMSALAGGIAHVFNNLLTAIGFETELALSRLPAEDPARKHLREIEKVGERAAEVARQLLAFSGSQVLHPRSMQLNNLLREMTEGLRRQLGDSIQIDTDLDPNLDPVQVDPEQIEQVVMNLASNARDVMPEGGRFTLRTTNVELAAGDLVHSWRTTPGRYVLLEVKDTGPGMKEEVRRRIFEPFFTTKRGSEAAGLGLSTVYGIVNQSGGQILAESEPGKGSTFLLYLPVPGGSTAGRTTEEEVAPWETILLVEDEENVRKPQAEILAARGYQVLEAADAAQALTLSRRHKGPIHLMVTDILMNGMSGVELAERLAFERPEMKVLFASGYPAGLAERPSLAQGDAPLLKKPFTGRALVAKVREVLESGD